MLDMRFRARWHWFVVKTLRVTFVYIRPPKTPCTNMFCRQAIQRLLEFSRGLFERWHSRGWIGLGCSDKIGQILFHSLLIIKKLAPMHIIRLHPCFLACWSVTLKQSTAHFLYWNKTHHVFSELQTFSGSTAICQSSLSFSDALRQGHSERRVHWYHFADGRQRSLCLGRGLLAIRGDLCSFSAKRFIFLAWVALLKTFQGFLCFCGRWANSSFRSALFLEDGLHAPCGVCFSRKIWSSRCFDFYGDRLLLRAMLLGFMMDVFLQSSASGIEILHCVCTVLNWSCHIMTRLAKKITQDHSSSPGCWSLPISGWLSHVCLLKIIIFSKLWWLQRRAFVKKPSGRSLFSARTLPGTCWFWAKSAGEIAIVSFFVLILLVALDRSQLSFQNDLLGICEKCGFC